MFTSERQSQILAALRLEGRVEVGELAQQHGVSEHTIRRDLNALEQQGHLQKTHGGAVIINNTQLDWQSRLAVLPASKHQIGTLGASLIQAGQTVILEAGTTTLVLAKSIAARPITIITNSLDIALVYNSQPTVRLLLTGGEWNLESRAFYGAAAQEVLSRHRADWTVLGTCALHPTAGATVTSQNDAAIKRAMLAAGLRHMVLADASKQDTIAAHLVLAVSELDIVVSDKPWNALKKRGVQVLTPQTLAQK
jgi:DeoR/GlpR family transcriptional regulator of sugar metabolism